MRPLWQAAALIASVAVSTVASEPITSPIWVVEPAEGALPYPFSSRDYRRTVEVICQTSGGMLTNCEPAGDAPLNFADAARTAAQVARMAELDGEGLATDGRTVAVYVRFPVLGIPVAIHPPPAPPASNILTSVTWLERPTAQDFARYYPREAMQARINGRVVLDCLVGANGRLACTVSSHEPPDQGFDEAGLRISRHFRMAGATQDGRPTAGGRARVPIVFRIE